MDKDAIGKVLFVVRNHGGVNLFNMRYQLIEQVTTDVLMCTTPMEMASKTRKAL